MDEDAERFLNDHRMERTVIVDVPKGEQLEKYNALRDRLVQMEEEAVQHKLALIKAQAQLEVSRAELEAEQAKTLAAMQAELTATRTELDASKKENSSYIRSWFGLYRKTQ